MIIFKGKKIAIVESRMALRKKNCSTKEECYKEIDDLMEKGYDVINWYEKEGFLKVVLKQKQKIDS